MHEYLIKRGNTNAANAKIIQNLVDGFLQQNPEVVQTRLKRITRMYRPGTFTEDTVIKWAFKQENRIEKGRDIVFSIEETVTNTTNTFKSGNLLSFSLQPYPACCGLTMFHSFYVQNPLDENKHKDFFQFLLGNILRYAHIHYLPINGQRLEAVMVSRNPDPPRPTRRSDAEYEDTSGEVQYQAFWDYFHEVCTKVTDRQFFNYNSTHHLHNLDIVLPSELINN